MAGYPHYACLFSIRPYGPGLRVNKSGPKKTSTLDLLSGGGHATGMYLFRAVGERVDSIAIQHSCTVNDVDTMTDMVVTFSNPDLPVRETLFFS
jgi:hypothetical protein